MDSKRRALKAIGDKAREWKAEGMKRKYGPKDEDDGLPSHLPTADEVKGRMSMHALEEAGEGNKALADDVVDENKRVLRELDDERMKHLLSGLQASGGSSTKTS